MVEFQVRHLSNTSNDKTSLQEAFRKFKERRKKQIMAAKQAEGMSVAQKADPLRVEDLRKKFVSQAMNYIGVPYAKSYHEEGTPEYDSPLFLDCCALVRRVLFDLKDDFGFKIGAWNQAYQFDTLPITIEKEEDMKPGDLVFISGTYYNPKSKKQKHDMVHVEIWYGEGEKTIGARWQKGRVKIHDSYKFIAKSYHRMVYHFKSIDTWLMGICKSFCPEHPWRRAKHLNHNKRSIFSSQNDDQIQRQESAGDETDTEGTSDQEKQNNSTKIKEVPFPITFNVEGSCDNNTLSPAVPIAEQNLSPKDLAIRQATLNGNTAINRPLKAKTESTLLGERIEPCLIASDVNQSSDLQILPSVQPPTVTNGINTDNHHMDVNDGTEIGTRNSSHPANFIFSYSFDNEDLLSAKSLSKAGLFFKEADIQQTVAYDITDATETKNYSCSKETSTFICTSNTRDQMQLKNNSSCDLESITFQSPHTTDHLVRRILDSEGVDPETCSDWYDKSDPDHEPECYCIDECFCNCTYCQMNSSLERDNTESHNRLTRGCSSCFTTMTPITEVEMLCRNCSPDPNNSKGKSSSPGKGRGQASVGTRARGRSKSPSKSPSKQQSSKPTVSHLTKGSHKIAPKFFIGGHNGVALVEGPLLEIGWQRIDDNQDPGYYLKWVECKSQINYRTFREGEQLVNHIPNGSVLTSKAGLLQSLQEYERIRNRVGNERTSERRCIREFCPETYSIEHKKQLEDFCSKFKDGEIWICKPSGANQGKGIFLVTDVEQLKSKLDDSQRERTRKARIPRARIIQRYITNPLLLNGYKFDIRAYMLIACTTPYIILYHKGYIRLSCIPFSTDCKDIHAHLTNQYIQKKHPLYSEKKEDTIWSFEKFNDYVNEKVKESKGLSDDWVVTVMTDRMKEIMLKCFRAVQNKLERRLGFFDLLGFDFMVDDDLKVWLIEINVNPALHTNCQTLREVVPGVVEETLKISIEAFEKKCSKRKIFPIESIKCFELIYEGETNNSFKASRRKAAQDIVKEVASEFPLKEIKPEHSQTENAGTLLPIATGINHETSTEGTGKPGTDSIEIEAD